MDVAFSDLSDLTELEESDEEVKSPVLVESTETRPKRTVNLPEKFKPKESARKPRPSKRKAQDESEARIENGPHNGLPLTVEFLLSDIYSPITKVDVSDILNTSTWAALSPESRDRLNKLLPPTAFANFEVTVDYSHPSQRQEPTAPKNTIKLGSDATANAIATNVPSESEPFNSDLSFFTDPHFESAARTFQDHLYSGWMTPSHLELIQDHLRGVKDGSMHAPWKDQAWEEQHVRAPISCMTDDAQALSGTTSSSHQTADFRLSVLAKNRLLQAGDILAYKRRFKIKGQDIVVQKDVMVSAIHTKNSTISVFYLQGKTTHLLPELLDPSLDVSKTPLPVVLPPDSPAVRMLTVCSPGTLEEAILNLDESVTQEYRSGKFAWKSFHLWRLPRGEVDDVDLEKCTQERGQRILSGTLFYLMCSL